MSSGGGAGRASSTTTTGPPGWLSPYQHGFVQNVQDFVNQDLSGGYPQGLNQQIAPFNNFQNQAFNQGQGLYPYAQNAAMNTFPQAQNYANQGAASLGNFAGGQMMPNVPTSQYSGSQYANSAMNPNIAAYANGQMMGPNPYLNQYYNQAAGQLSNQYKEATQPSLQAQFQQAGAFNSPGFAEAQGQAQNQLGNSLATLGANIYEPAYQFESGQRLGAANTAQQNQQFNVANLLQNRQFNAGNRLQNQQFNVGNQLQGQEYGLGQQLAAAQGMPAAAQGMFGPLANMLGLGQQSIQGLYGLGSAQQQQGQNQLNANQSNTAQGINYPFAILNQLGSSLGLGNLGAGVSTSQGPSPGGGK